MSLVQNGPAYKKVWANLLLVSWRVDSYWLFVWNYSIDEVNEDQAEGTMKTSFLNIMHVYWYTLSHIYASMSQA